MNQIHQKVLLSRQESKSSLDNTDSALQDELAWNQEASVTCEDEVKKRQDFLSDSQKKGVRGINPLWQQYDEILNSQMREWVVYKYKLPGYKSNLQQFKKVVALLRGEWESNNNELASVVEVFCEESDRNEYYPTKKSRFDEIKTQVEKTSEEIQKIGQSQRQARPRIKMIEAPAKHSVEYLQWCEWVGQDNPDSPTTQRFYKNRNETVLSYIGQFRSGKIKEILPKRALNMLIEEALIERIVDGRNISKLLGDTRDKFQR